MNPHTETGKSLHERQLPNDACGQVDKSGLNLVQAASNQDKIAEAILVINKLPLTDTEKADMVRLLLG